MLAEAKAEWGRLGRDPAKLHTDFRFFDFIYPFDRTYSPAELRDIWRANYRRFVDRTYLERFAAHVDSVEELNEYYDTRMAHDPAFLAPFLASARSAVEVWNSEFRGRVVTSSDGGQGLIPASCRLVIGNSPVGNDVAREFYQLAVASDNILGVHPYSKWERRQRDTQDFRYHSGRWNWDEQTYGIKPVYAFTECGPYLDAAQGWRYADCMGADMGLLLGGMRDWVRDVATTGAYREGRILGPGAFFTQGGFGWEWYQYTTDELVELYKMLAVEWRPPAPGTAPIPVPVPNPIGDDMDAQQTAYINARLDTITTATAEIRAAVNPPWWMVPALPFVVVAARQPLTTYVAPNGAVRDVRQNATYDLNVSERTADGWLKVAPTPLWVKAADVRLK